MSKTTRRATPGEGKAKLQGKRKKPSSITTKTVVDRVLKAAYSRYAPGAETARALRSLLKKRR